MPTRRTPAIPIRADDFLWCLTRRYCRPNIANRPQRKFALSVRPMSAIGGILSEIAIYQRMITTGADCAYVRLTLLPDRDAAAACFRLGKQ